MDTYCINIKHSKCYLVRVNEFYIAIDAGWPGYINEYLSGLKANNIKADEIKYLFVTHFHPDHAGLVENIKKFGTGFVVFEHQIPYIKVMERMIKNDSFYMPINMDTNLVIDIERADSFLKENNIPAKIIRTTGHSDDSISIVFNEGCSFIGDLYNQELIMEDDKKSKHSWCELKKNGAGKIYPAHGNVYEIEKSSTSETF